MGTTRKDTPQIKGYVVSVIWKRKEGREGRMAKPELIIDTNERGKLCESVLRKAEKQGLIVGRKALVVGDYLMGGACVEAKSINDLFQSSHSGHLWRQLDNMDANYERFFLVIHGDIPKYVAMAKSNGRRITYSRVQSELTGPSLVSWLTLIVRSSIPSTSAKRPCSLPNYTTNYTSQRPDMGRGRLEEWLLMM